MSQKKTGWLAAALALQACAAFAQTNLAPVAASAIRGADQRALMQQLRDDDKAATNVYKAYFPSAALGRKAAISFHNELLESRYDEGYLVLELAPEDIAKLQRFGFKLKPAVEFMAQRRSTLQKIDQLAAQAEGQNAGIFSVPGYSCYETVEESYAAAQSFATTHPTLASWLVVGRSWEKQAGLGGYDIRVLKLTNSAIGGNKPKLFVNSAIHAREYTTAPVALEFARWLINGYGNNADATWILDHHEVHLLLQSNPDGRKKAEGGLSWRKNTNTAYCGATSNYRGVDLNRNFTQSWNSTQGEGSSGNECNLTYRGPSAASEPETQAIESYVRSLWPDRRGPNSGDAAPANTSGIHIDLHSYSQLVLWPWGDTDTLAPNAAALQTLGRKLAYFNGYTPQQSVGLYPTDGTSDAVSYGELGVAAFTIEMGTSFFQSCSAYESDIKPKNLNALIYAAKVVRTPYITPGGPELSSVSLSHQAAGTGVQTGTVVTLATSANDTRFNNSNGTEASQNIAAVEYYIDTPPWVAGATAVPLLPSDGRFDTPIESAKAFINTGYLRVGKHLVYVRARDAGGTWGPISASFLVVNP